MPTACRTSSLYNVTKSTVAKLPTSDILPGLPGQTISVAPTAIGHPLTVAFEDVLVMLVGVTAVVIQKTFSTVAGVLHTTADVVVGIVAAMGVGIVAATIVAI